MRQLREAEAQVATHVDTRCSKHECEESKSDVEAKTQLKRTKGVQG